MDDAISYTRLQSILFVKELQTEIEFYSLLGFEISYQTQRFVAFSHGDCILFGLQEKPGIDTIGFAEYAIWQIGVENIYIVYELCEHAGIRILQEPTLQEWGEWVMKVLSPNGYTIVFEGKGC